MKKIKNRAYFAIIIAIAITAGLGVYIIQLWSKGGDWAMMRANQSVFSQGVLNTGTVTDRNGVVLAQAGDGVYMYAADEIVRRACLHAVGDYGGNIGTGVLSVFEDKLAGYTFVDGVNSPTGGGKTLELTIDSDLQVAALNALAGRRGAVMVMNYETGEVLCMVSTPTFDPNYGVDISSQANEGAYLNRCISAAYVPGSVFKLVTLTAAIENIDDLYNRSFYCGGSVAVGGDTIVCTGTHGTQTIEQAFANSCNCAFSELSQELGGELLAEYAKKMGLTDSLNISGISTSAGNFDNAAAGSSDLSWSGIGQYTDLVTPAAMMRIAAAVAGGGTLSEQKLLAKDSTRKTQLMSEDTAEKMRAFMNYNVAYSYGEWLFPGVKMFAKTGTAEVGDGSSHAWFVGFTGSDTKPLAFAVVIENAGGGLANAAPVANQVIQAAIG